jgi:DNA-binding response OmpR family regulator
VGKQIDILVIDDNDIQLEFLEHLFTTHGYTCFTSDDNRTSVKLIQDKKPKLVLLDIMMPNIDGFTILKQIRDTEGLEKLPVIIYTSKAYPVDQKKAMNLGASSYLIKPIKGSEIIAEVKKYI